MRMVPVCIDTWNTMGLCMICTRRLAGSGPHEGADPTTRWMRSESQPLVPPTRLSPGKPTRAHFTRLFCVYFSFRRDGKQL